MTAWAILLLALLAGLARAHPQPAIPFDKTTLPNGLELILVEDHRLPIVAVNIWCHVGPANEKPDLTGFAHLFEHMMFAGSRHLPRGAADKFLEGAGATDSNGSTDYDRTNYYDTVPGNQLELALWVHADRMGYLLLADVRDFFTVPRPVVATPPVTAERLTSSTNTTSTRATPATCRATWNACAA